jgi:hypothetical protein
MLDTWYSFSPSTSMRGDGLCIVLLGDRPPLDPNMRLVVLNGSVRPREALTDKHTEISWEGHEMVPPVSNPASR